MTEKVIEIRDWRDTAHIKRGDILRDCRHPRVSVAEKDWTVECRDCGKPVDPVGFIRQLAREGEKLRRKERAVEEAEKLIVALVDRGGRIVIDKNGCRSEMIVNGKRRRRSGRGLSIFESLVSSLRSWPKEVP